MPMSMASLCHQQTILFADALLAFVTDFMAKAYP